MRESVAASPELAVDRPWWKGAVIYQVYPRSFADSNGDGIGDLPGITRRLEYIASLGVDAIWISPFFTSPMKDFGYDVADYCDVDPIFGTLADFDELIEKAHRLGLRLLLDQVFSHSSDQHVWFSESRGSRDNPRADWYVWADAKPDGSPPNNWQSVFGGPAWTWDARRGQYYMHNFLTSQPQLNCHLPAVQDALLASMRFWLDRGVDGFRMDAVNFAMHDPALTDNPPAPPSNSPRSRPFDFQLHIHNQSHPDIPNFIERIRALTDEYAGCFTFAEVGGSDSEREMKTFTRGQHRFNSAYGFDFLYASALTPVLVREALETWPDDPDGGWPSWAFSNHDAPRWISRWAPADRPLDFARIVMLLFMCLRGNVIIWQGEELGLTQVEIDFDQLHDPEAIANWPLTLSRDGTRTPMPWLASAPALGFSDGTPWLPFGTDHRDAAVDNQEEDPSSLLALTRQLIAIRRRLPALRHGSVSIVEASETLLAFTRKAPGQTLLCVINFGAQPTLWPSAPSGQWRLITSIGGAKDWSFPAYSGLIAERIS